jgi:hypothetical protein
MAKLTRIKGGDGVVMPVDDALALAEHVLAAYCASGLEDTPGPDLLWADQLARALRKLADAVSVRHVAPVGARPVAVIRRAGQAGDGAARPAGRRAGRAGRGLARMLRGRVGRVPGPGAVVLSVAEAETAGLALADAGAWQAVYGDCAPCVGDGECADPGRHEGIAAAYVALRARLAGEAR